MKTNKLVAVGATALGSLLTLTAWAKSERFVQVYIGGQLQEEYVASRIDHIDVVDRIVPPEAPAGVTATFADGRVCLRWDEADGAAYNVYRSADRETYVLIAGNLHTNGYTDEEPLQGYNYYLVKSVDDAGESAVGVAALVSASQSGFVTGTLCGHRDETDSQWWVYGPFSSTTGFRHEGTLAFDPLHPERLYAVYDTWYGQLFDEKAGKIDQLDLESCTHSRLLSGTSFGDEQRLRNCAFTGDGRYMLVSSDSNTDGYSSPGVWIVERVLSGAFTDNRRLIKRLALYKQCNSVAVHPVNGEVYFSSYENGKLFRLDLDKYFETSGQWTGLAGDYCFEEVFGMDDPSWEFSIVIHPSGDYAYLNCINRNCIYRTDYNHETHRFGAPYRVAGRMFNMGFADGTADDAVIGRPYQGVFVKNPDYAGTDDEYDYYFTDSYNCCVRRLTPGSTVNTVAGRVPDAGGNICGYADGEDALFGGVSGIAYDERTETFYVLDHDNRCVRTLRKK